jgi:hypothetical protein
MRAAADAAGWRPASRRPAAWRSAAAAAAAAAASVTWAATPLRDGHAGTRAALVVAICCAILSVARTAVVRLRPRESPSLGTTAERLGDRLLSFVRAAQWAEGTLLAVLALAALRSAPPWHTGVLGLLVLAYLFAVHLAETGARPGVLHPQLPAIAAGLGLLVLAVAAAALPQPPGGGGSVIRAVAVVGAVVVAAVLVPATWARRR